MRAILILLLSIGYISCQNGSIQLVASENEWGLLDDVLQELIQQENNLWNYLRQFEDRHDETDDGEWVMKVRGGLDNAIRIANETKITLKRQVRGFDDYYVFERQYPEGIRSKRSTGELFRHIRELQQVIWVEHQDPRIRQKRYIQFNDPLWSSQWEMKRSTNNNPGSMRLPEAWSEGYTGTGVTVNVLDDGLDHRHPDLSRNYAPEASYDLNGNDNDPTPRYNDDNKHGTRCAGEIAMIANNSVCGVGAAFNSRIAGVRMLDGVITDRLEMEALVTGLKTVDVYSSSWGPSDDGSTVEGPGRLATMGILKGIREGRNGKGVIYVWASGNGGSSDDDCNCDGYASSIYTFSVSAADERGYVPWYAEACSSTIATTYSSGGSREQMITTTDIQGKCTTKHSGTSAAAPLAAGIIALTLEANPSLTWRDVQHLTVWTSNPAPLFKDGGEWHMNGFGLLTSNNFGFGLMDAYELVTTAKKWINVPSQKACSINLPGFYRRTISSGLDTTIKFTVDGCKGKTNEINYLEHVQVITDISHTKRGNLEIYLVSPQGTKTRLLGARSKDKSRNGFRNWPFTSLHTWGENPSGTWELHIIDIGKSSKSATGTVNNISMVLYGTTQMPKHYSEKRIYNNVDLSKLDSQKRVPFGTTFQNNNNNQRFNNNFNHNRPMLNNNMMIRPFFFNFGGTKRSITDNNGLIRHPRRILDNLVKELSNKRKQL